MCVCVQHCDSASCGSCSLIRFPSELDSEKLNDAIRGGGGRVMQLPEIHHQQNEIPFRRVRRLCTWPPVSSKSNAIYVMQINPFVMSQIAWQIGIVF